MARVPVVSAISYFRTNAYLRDGVRRGHAVTVSLKGILANNKRRVRHAGIESTDTMRRNAVVALVADIGHRLVEIAAIFARSCTYRV